jgi:excisionase family DNA binding protein
MARATVEPAAWSVSDVARRLAVHRDTVYAWVWSGKLASYSLPTGTIRIPDSAVRELLRERER